jgi:hypothetical protein
MQMSKLIFGDEKKDAGVPFVGQGAPFVGRRDYFVELDFLKP